MCDLIETLWNVKIPDDVLENNGTLDLIETLWNVKRGIDRRCPDRKSGI